MKVIINQNGKPIGVVDFNSLLTAYRIENSLFVLAPQELVFNDLKDQDFENFIEQIKELNNVLKK